MWWGLLSLAMAADWPSIDAPLRSGAKAPADAAVVVGIEDYGFVADVPYARRDAAAFWDWLVSSRGVPLAQVKRLDAATKEDMVEALQAAAGATGEGGTLWVYFAGHGAASPTTRERLLLGVDVQGKEQSLESRGLSLSALEKLAVAGKAKRVVVVVDACYAGVGRAGEELVAGKRFAVPVSAIQTAPKVVIWSATSENELSGPLDETQHGLFTWLVLGGLRGWADGELSGDRDGKVTLGEAQLYVQRGVGSLNRHAQKPSMETRAEVGEWDLISSKKLEKAPDLAALIREASPKPSPAPSPAPFPKPVAAPDPVPVARRGGGDDDDQQQQQVQSWEPPPELPAEFGGKPLGQTAWAGAAGDIQRSPSTGYEMIRIQPGTFKMGASRTEVGREDDETQHSVTLTQGLWVGRTEFTAGQLAAAMPDYAPLAEMCPNCPIWGSSWADAVQFANYLSTVDGFAPVYDLDGQFPVMNPRADGYRLPTEAEWEYFARAGQSAAPDPSAVWTADDGVILQPVGLLAPNPWGLHDVGGNVWELCWDSYESLGAGAVTDPVFNGPNYYRVIRGGAFDSPLLDARPAQRAWIDPLTESPNVGFRLVRTAR